MPDRALHSFEGPQAPRLNQSRSLIKACGRSISSQAVSEEKLMSTIHRQSVPAIMDFPDTMVSNTRDLIVHRTLARYCELGTSRGACDMLRNAADCQQACPRSKRTRSYYLP